MSFAHTLSKFQEMIASARESSLSTLASSPFLSSASKSLPAARTAGLDNVKVGLSFNYMEGESFNINHVLDSSDPPVHLEHLSSGPAGTDGNVMINWLLDMTKTIIAKINQHGKLLKFTQRVVESKVSQEEVQELRVLVQELKATQEQREEEQVQVVQGLRSKVKELEGECEDVRQRSMKGTLFLNSPHSSTADSLLLPRNTTVNEVLRKETPVEVVTRAIFAKTGVRVPEQDLQACHTLGRPGASPNTSYIVRFSNLRPGSAWDILAAGLLTGRNKETKQNFDSSVALYLNFQLSRSKNQLAKVVRDAKRARRIAKYGIDQNGRVTVKVSVDSPSWVEVHSEEELTGLVVAAPPPATVSTARRSQGHRR